MSIYENLMPGLWQDSIDVNDFVNLNKKPFSKEALFLKRHDKIEITNITPIKQKGSIYEATPKIEQVITHPIRKMIRSGLIIQPPYDKIPSFSFPDIRRIALYGTKKLIEDRREYFRFLDEDLQTPDWIYERISIHEEIDALKKLEKFAQNQHVEVSKPAENAKDAFSSIYVTLLAMILENPSIPLTISQLFPFLDIFLEAEIEQKKINEDKAQQLVDEFVRKLVVLPTNNFIWNETITIDSICKSSYRFLSSIFYFDLPNFSLSIVYDPELPLYFKTYCEKAIEKKHEIRFFHNHQYNSEEQHFFKNSQIEILGQSLLFQAGCCDLKKIFIASLQENKLTNPTFEEAKTTFESFLSFVLTTQTELVNLALFFSRNGNHFPLRSAFNDMNLRSQVQFSFSQLQLVFKAFLSLKKEEETFIKNEAGEIIDFVEFSLIPTIEESVLLEEWVLWIEKELERIPLYKNASFSLRFYPEDLNTITTEKPREVFCLNENPNNHSFPIIAALNEKDEMEDFLSLLDDFSITEIQFLLKKLILNKNNML